MKNLLLCLSFGTCLVSSSQAVILAGWTFETSLPASAGPHTAESGVFAGSSVATGLHASASTVYSNPVGNGSLESFSSNFWAVGDYYQFASSSTGYEDITISFDQVGSSTGPRDFQFSYSTNGTTFTDFGSAYAVLANSTPNNWSAGTPVLTTTFSFDLSSVTGLDNAATIYFRLTQTTTTSIGGGTVATGGTNRVDNFIINGVPEPTTALLGALGVLGLLRRRR